MASAVITVGKPYRYHRLCKGSDSQWRDRLGGTFRVEGFGINLVTLAEEIILHGDSGEWFVCSPRKFALCFVPVTEPVVDAAKVKSAGVDSSTWPEH
jgi:hypothetical protein